MGRTGHGAFGPLHGRPHQHAMEPRNSSALPTPQSSRQAVQGRPRRLHAQAAHDSQRHASRPHPLAFSGDSSLTKDTATRAPAAERQYRWTASAVVLWGLRWGTRAADCGLMGFEVAAAIAPVSVGLDARADRKR